MRKLVLLIAALMLFGFNNVKAQTPQQDLSKGNYLLMQKPFQIEAVAFGKANNNGVLTPYFNPDTYDLSKFSSFIVWDTENLQEFPLEVQTNKTWSKFVTIHHDPTTTELNNFSTLFRLQIEDDNLNPANSTVINDADIFFKYARSIPAYNNAILSIDLPPYGYSEEQLKSMLSLLKPDLIMFNRYPWALPSQNANESQLLYGWYGMLIYNRNIALKGNNGTGDTPIPFGAYTQTYIADLNPLTPPSDSQMRLNHFGSLVFGAKMLSAFVYNDSTHHAEILKSFLFDSNGLPNSRFAEQAIINQQITNLGPALIQLQTEDIRFIHGSKSVWPRSSPDIEPYRWVEDRARPDAYLTAVTATRSDSGLSEVKGDVLVGYFHPIHKSLDGTNTTNENYFMVVNGLYEADNNISTFQTIRLNFDFGTVSTINSLLRLNRLTGNIENIPLVKENVAGNKYYLDLVLNGGEGDLFKYKDDVSFVGFPSLTVAGAPSIGTATSGNAQATVNFTAPASNGGSAITSYTATSSLGNFTVTGSASPLIVLGLTNGTAYTFTVKATNAIGTGAASTNSNSIIPIDPNVPQTAAPMPPNRLPSDVISIFGGTAPSSGRLMKPKK